ncbi:signal peptidase I [Aquimarina aggregata]|uniref:signal peptidase I n=1 Tax=Aquimarina aggregata TaxID=1642818 RepID=UPI0024920B43|nr:signal peptidase I [Aquimarina aggregata]
MKKGIHSKLKIKLRSFIILIVVLSSVILFKIIIADLYYIPTESMEKTIDRKSYAILSKVMYGALLPKSTHEIPLTSKILKKFPSVKLWNETRAYGFTKVKRNDIIVAKYNTMKIAKRIVGIAGDTIKIENGLVFINTQKEEILDSFLYKYTGEFNKEEVKDLKQKTNLTYLGNQLFDITLDGSILKGLKNKKLVAQSFDENNFNKSKDSISPMSMYGIWDKNNYGPILIPYKGFKIKLNQSNYDLYKDTIDAYEDIKLCEENCKYMIDEREVKFYKFKNDYFFLMGDNRMGSIDSRFIGFIPKKNILGKIIYWF